MAWFLYLHRAKRGIFCPVEIRSNGLSFVRFEKAKGEIRHYRYKRTPFYAMKLLTIIRFTMSTVVKIVVLKISVWTRNPSARRKIVVFWDEKTYLKRPATLLTSKPPNGHQVGLSKKVLIHHHGSGGCKIAGG